VYPLVENMAEKLGVEPGELVGNDRALDGLDPDGFAGNGFELDTVYEIFRELRSGGADPRGVFEAPNFRADVKTLEDLQTGMTLEGVVTNIASFGAFVDVGVDQEGLVHVSELSDDFVEDPGAVVSVGQRVSVRVIGIDNERKRLSLSRRTPGAKKPRRGERPGGPPQGGRKPGGRPGGGGPGRGKPGERGKPGGPGRGGPGRGGPGRGGPGRGDRKPGGRKGGGRKPGGKGRGDKRGPRRDDYDDKRAPRIIDVKGKREPEPEIDKNLPEEEQFRLKLERLRKKFEQGS
jgi:uncharacterized protein